MLFIDGSEHTVGVNTFFSLFSVHVSLEEDSCLSLSNVVAGKEFTDFLNLLLVGFVCICRFGNLVLQHYNCIVLCEEVFHLFCTVERFYHTVILVEQSLFCHNIEVESVSLFHITVEDFIKLFSVTEGHLGHLLCHAVLALVVALKFHLIILVFHQTGAHTEVRSGVVGRIQTALVHINLLVNKYPAFSIALGSTVTFKVCTVDSPGTPVALGESLGVTTGYERVEVGRYNLVGLEDQIQTFGVGAAPLGGSIAVEHTLRTFA